MFYLASLLGSLITMSIEERRKRDNVEDLMFPNHEFMIIGPVEI